MLSLMGMAGARLGCGSVRGERLMLSMKGLAYLCRSATPSSSPFAEDVGIEMAAGWGFTSLVKSCVQNNLRRSRIRTQFCFYPVWCAIFGSISEAYDVSEASVRLARPSCFHGEKKMKAVSIVLFAATIG